ncbi:MAG: glycerol-3-phosphate 1-O-acyltransferase PlsY [Kangiellaceae bacterium]|nr:glycerol-3-phosphate 1-O-acyltransferase PlsY [Kangiellaceae bacterium]
MSKKRALAEVIGEKSARSNSIWIGDHLQSGLYSAPTHRPPDNLMDLLFIALLTFAYLSGSISSAVLVCRLFTLPDPRIVGSKNPGATNVLRIGGRSAAFATLLGDILKTALPIGVSFWLGNSHTSLLWIGAAALFGHCFPVYFKFEGGKGVASMMTTVILVTPQFALLALGCWLISAWTFKRSSVASLITAFVLPVYASQFAAELLLPMASLSAIVLLRHRKNVENIVRGQEPIIGH